MFFIKCSTRKKDWCTKKHPFHLLICFEQCRYCHWLLHTFYFLSRLYNNFLFVHDCTGSTDKILQVLDHAECSPFRMGQQVLLSFWTICTCTFWPPPDNLLNRKWRFTYHAFKFLQEDFKGNADILSNEPYLYASSAKCTKLWILYTREFLPLRFQKCWIKITSEKFICIIVIVLTKSSIK